MHLQYQIPMFTHCMSRIRFLSSATRNNTTTTTTTTTTWDPIISLSFNHPTLVILETQCQTRHHFKQILSQMIRLNLISQTFPMSRLLCFSCIKHPQNLELGLSLFHHFKSNPNLYIYNTLILALTPWKMRSFGLYGSLLRSRVFPDKNTLLYLLRGSKNELLDGKRIHCHAVVLGLWSDGYVQNSLIKMYLANGRMGYARKVFDEMGTPDIVTFNIMIAEHAKVGSGVDAIEFFHRMVSVGLEPDGFTMLGVLVCCGKMGSVYMGKSVHGWMERRSLLDSNLILRNSLLDMYARCNELELARIFFLSMEEKDAISWNTMIGGYARAGELDIACASLDEMPIRDTVSWNSIVSEYSRKGDYVMARRLFDKMNSENVEPDEATLVSLVSAVTEVRVLNQGSSVHGFAIRRLMNCKSFLGSALIHMYSKCGEIGKAFMVFQEVTESERDVTLWTTMISGCAFHGYGSKALELFSKMQKHVMPSHVTLVAILNACSHSGLVDEGLNIFNSMVERYGIEPEREHYACVVDLLSRSGKVKDAVQVIENMPMKAGQSIWGSLLNACKAPDDAEIAKLASRELLKLDPEEEGGYLLLSNLYVSSGKWRYSDKIRNAMENHCGKKTAGSSSLVV